MMMNPRHNATVTNTAFGVSGTTGYRTDGYQLSIYRHHTFYRDGEARHVTQYGDGNNMKFPIDKFAGSSAERSYSLEHGYIKYYSRNTCKFVSSRAYRKHTGKPYYDKCEYPNMVALSWELGADTARRQIFRKYGYNISNSDIDMMCRKLSDYKFDSYSDLGKFLLYKCFYSNEDICKCVGELIELIARIQREHGHSYSRWTDAELDDECATLNRIIDILMSA